MQIQLFKILYRELHGVEVRRGLITREFKEARIFFAKEASRGK